MYRSSLGACIFNRCVCARMCVCANISFYLQYFLDMFNGCVCVCLNACFYMCLFVFVVNVDGAEVLTVCDNVTLQIKYGYVTNDSNTIKDIQVGVKEREKKEQKKTKSKPNDERKMIKIIEQQ